MAHAASLLELVLLGARWHPLELALLRNLLLLLWYVTGLLAASVVLLVVLFEGEHLGRLVIGVHRIVVLLLLVGV